MNITHTTPRCYGGDWIPYGGAGGLGRARVVAST